MQKTLMRFLNEAGQRKSQQKLILKKLINKQQKIENEGKDKKKKKKKQCFRSAMKLCINIAKS